MDESNLENFIESVKGMPILYNLTNPQYKNTKKKAEIWKDIAEEYKLNIEVCKNKWKRLRDSYNRDKLKNGKVSGQEAEEEGSGWKYAKQMEFLADHVKPRTMKSNYSAENEEYRLDGTTGDSSSLAAFEIDSMFDEAVFSPPSGHEICGESLSSLPCPESSTSIENRQEKEICSSTPVTRCSGVRMKRRNVEQGLEENLLGTMSSIQSFLKNREEAAAASSTASDEGEDNLFCRSLVQKLNKFPLRIKSEAKVQLLSYLNELELSLYDCKV